MKKAEFLLNVMDQLHAFIDTINHYISAGISYFEIAKEWVQKILEYIQQAIDKLVDLIGGRPEHVDHLQFQDEDLFV